jgi:hypothetical protein
MTMTMRLGLGIPAEGKFVAGEVEKQRVLDHIEVAGAVM